MFFDIDYTKIPKHMRKLMTEYMEEGRHPGRDSFLEAVLENNLIQAFMRADEINFENMRQWAFFMYQCIPRMARGSRENVIDWCEVQSMFVKMAAQNVRPDGCPWCRRLTLWPASHKHLNCLNRKPDAVESEKYVCEPCGYHQSLIASGNEDGEL